MMQPRYPLRIIYACLVTLLLIPVFLSCRQQVAQSTAVGTPASLQSYVEGRTNDPEWELRDSLVGEGYRTYVLYMISQDWLTTKEVKDPTWWHWLTVVVPDSIQSSSGLLFIGGGNRKRKQPKDAGEEFIQTALLSHSIVAELHNVPNQPLEFVSDDYGPRDEDEIIAYGWRKFMEGGAKDSDAKWLARMPMTTAAVVAMDVLQDFSQTKVTIPLEKFVVAGGSKRGWTTWTTGAVDRRVEAIVPIVIDMLNVVPSFEHHWRVYGKWAAAVGDYEHEGVMEWQQSKEYNKLISLTEPYSMREKLTMPKMIISATGDQFFLPDSWQFYWNDLKGEKHLRYVPNSEHSMRETDAWSTLVAFYKMIVEKQTRPEFDWSVSGDTLKFNTGNIVPDSIKLWRAHNPEARNFQVDSIGRAYQSTPIDISDDGLYEVVLTQEANGWVASFVELAYHDQSGIPLKLSTGVVVRPDTYPYAPFKSVSPKGAPMAKD